MDRILGANTIDLGGGRRGFRGKDTVAGIPGTELSAVWHNAIQEEICGFAELCGFVLSAGDLTQLAQAVRSGALNFKAAGGSANDLTVNLIPDLAAYTPGLPLRLVTGAAANTGPMTIAVDALAAKALLRRGGEPLEPGDVPAASVLEVIYDGAAFRCTGLVRSDVAGMVIGSKLPIHAEVKTGDGRLTIAAAGGNIVVTGATLLWRGWKEFDLTALSLANRTLATVANKTYHLRWDAPGTGQATPATNYPNGRFTLRDLADAGYNAGAAAETSSVFDTTYDSVLIARVVTNGANAATVTALSNKTELLASASGLAGTNTNLSANYQSTATAVFTLNWGRLPRIWVPVGYHVQSGGPALEWANQTQKLLENRYGLTATVTSNWKETDPSMATLTGYLNFDAMA